MKKPFILAAATLFSFLLNAQSYTFEDEVPDVFEQPTDAGFITLTTERSKEGAKSLLWTWYGQSTLRVTDKTSFNTANNGFSNRGGVTFWIYNEKKRDTPLHVRFVDENGNVCYQFHFNLEHTGWKACWMAFINMKDANWQKVTRVSGVNLTMEVISPVEEGESDGRLFIDRFKILNSLPAQTMPDAQIPDNNYVVNSGPPTHWGRLWEWEQLEYDMPLPQAVTAEESADLKKLADNIKASYKRSALDVTNLLATLRSEGIGIEGVTPVKPLVTKNDPFYSSSKEYNLTNLTTLLNQLSRAAIGSNNAEAREMFPKVMKWAMDQGFSFGSCMGGNDHYGYEIRNTFIATLWMKDALAEAGILNEVADAISYWAALPETRQPYDLERDQLPDCWNTLTVARLCAALLYETEAEQLRAVRSLFRWVSQSLCITPGTIGGIKPDFTGFHHGGHYPAYSVPGYAAIGEMLSHACGTQFGLDTDGKETFKNALLAVGRYTNNIDWGIGVCGRHPLRGTSKISVKGQQAFAHLARAYTPVDRELAAEFLRICEDNTAASTKLVNEFLALGITPAAQEGFAVFNWSCFGTFRKDNWMLSLKGFNKYVWGSEIYTSNNRYGRYQSYGSTQLIVGSEADSRWDHDGWNWNRLPGTTTIHLPFDRLNSPQSGTLMMRSTETFSGASHLLGKYGVFATKIKEGNLAYFTPSFVARKSVFCIGNRAIYIGTGINCTQTQPNIYPVETTLFQQKLNADAESFLFEDTSMDGFPINQTEDLNAVTLFSDLIGNYYRVEAGQQVVMLKQDQTSKHSETKANTNGKFATLYISHGYNPTDASYEYMMAIQPEAAQIAGLHEKSYNVLRKDHVAHIVEDKLEGVIGYALFEPYSDENGQYVVSADEELLIMLQQGLNENLLISVCDPNINIGDDSYTTTSVSMPITKEFVLKGLWKMAIDNINISIFPNISTGTTLVVANCINGESLQFGLDKESDATSIVALSDDQNVSVEGNVLIVKGDNAVLVEVFDLQGICIKSVHKADYELRIVLPKGAFIVQQKLDGVIFRDKIII